ncbi:hypothetical protein [Streptomyces mirabilis]
MDTVRGALQRSGQPPFRLAEDDVGERPPPAALSPQALMLDADPAPSDFDSGDHVNLTEHGYSSISNSFGLASLGPDA